ncbi:MAG: hypothetical protein IKR50_04255 [Prevotella sp.]|nr:hypothetical protein [Prevotella sp.]
MKRKAIIILTALSAIVMAVKAAPTGSWADDYYVWTVDEYNAKSSFDINNMRSLAGFAKLVNSGYDFSGKTVTLKYDLDLAEHYWVPIGNRDADGNDTPFRGTFDGGGHTINNIVLADPTGNYETLAGFFGIIGEGGTVKNLRISNSTIVGKNLLGGIAAYNYCGTITGCIVESSVTIAQYQNEGEDLGGIAGLSIGLVSGCVSKAQFVVGSTIYSVGGIVGRFDFNSKGYPHDVQDCLFFGTTLPACSQGEYNWRQSGPIIGERKASSTFAHNYYTTSGLPNYCGIGSVAYAVKCGEENATLQFDGPPTATYGLSGISSFGYGLQYGSIFYAPTGETVRFGVAAKASGVSVDKVYADGVELTADGGLYAITIGSADVTVTADLSVSSLPGSGTESAPYEISTVSDWEKFATLVGNGYNFRGDYVQLKADITLTHEEPISTGGFTPHFVGTGGNRFEGTFDGDGHTITLDQTTHKNDTPSALFRYVRNATIKNLIVDGSFVNTFYAVYNAGLVAVADGANTVSNCLVKTAMTCDATASSVTGIAGIVGHLQNTSGMANWLTMTGCAFLGSMLKYRDEVAPKSVGGLLGYADSGTTATLTDCLFDPVRVTMGTTGSSTLARCGSQTTLTIDACYYTQSLGQEQGTEAAASSTGTGAGDAGTSHGYITHHANGLRLSISGQGGSTYYIPTTGSEATALMLSDNAPNSSTLWTYMGRTVNVTIEGRTLHKDGTWNTVCLPFALSAEELAAAKATPTHPLYQAVVKELDFTHSFDANGNIDNDDEDDYYTHFDASDGTLYLYFSDATAMVAGKPYIVKWTGGTSLTDPTFEGVTIGASSALTEGSELGVSFVGTFDPTPLTVGSSANLFIGAGNQLFYPSGVSHYDVGPFRAYFKVDASEGSATGGGDGVRSIIMNLDDEAASVHPLVFSQTPTVSGRTVYDIGGRPFNSNSQLPRGIYIKNRKKFKIDGF